MPKHAIRDSRNETIRSHAQNNLQIIMGDFNSVCNPSLDKSSVQSNTCHKKPSDIIQLLQQQDYIDSYRFLHPDNRVYTWKSSSNVNIQTRIDYIWFNDSQLNLLAHSDIIEADIIM